MDAACLCFRGPRGSGKRTHLLKCLETIAKNRKLNWSIQKKSWAIEPNDDADEGVSIPYETSLVHIGFDVARMSMQDKSYLQNIVGRLGDGSNVLGGKSSGGRILVLYHAQYLSNDSVLLLHAALERGDGNLLLWITCEEGPPLDLADYFFKISVGGPDRKLAALRKELGGGGKDTQTWFNEIVLDWIGRPMELKRIISAREMVYTCLLRNIRFQDMISYFLDAMLAASDKEKLNNKKLLAGVAALCSIDATGGGQTLPSYRLPLAWEAAFLRIQRALG